jgi:hypothetical protein
MTGVCVSLRSVLGLLFEVLRGYDQVVQNMPLMKSACQLEWLTHDGYAMMELHSKRGDLS